MYEGDLILQLSIVIIVTTVLSVILELSKQPLLIAFIFSGLLIGPQGLGLIDSNVFFQAIGQIGIILLLYLIGLELKNEANVGDIWKRHVDYTYFKRRHICSWFVNWITSANRTS